MDAVASIVLDLVLSRQPEPRLVNVVHPQPTPWDTIIKQINNFAGANLPTIPYAEWLNKLEAHGKDSSSQILVTIVSRAALFSLHEFTQLFIHLASPPLSCSPSSAVLRAKQVVLPRRKRAGLLPL